MKALMRSVSSRFRRVKIPGRSIPVIGGRIGVAPGARISLSYDSSYSRPSARLRTRTFFAARSIDSTRVCVRTSNRNRFFKSAGLTTSSFSRSVISPPM